MLPEYVTDWITTADSLHAHIKGRELTPTEYQLLNVINVGLSNALRRYGKETYPTSSAASRYLGMG